MRQYGQNNGSEIEADVMPVTHQSTGKLNPGANSGTMGKDGKT